MTPQPDEQRAAAHGARNRMHVSGMQRNPGARLGAMSQQGVGIGRKLPARHGCAIPADDAQPVQLPSMLMGCPDTEAASGIHGFDDIWTR